MSCLPLNNCYLSKLLATLQTSWCNLKVHTSLGCWGSGKGLWVMRMGTKRTIKIIPSRSKREKRLIHLKRERIWEG